MNDTIRQSQNYSWSRSHREHADRNWADMIACDEELAYAIDADDYGTVVARDLRIGMVVRWNEYTDLTVTNIEIMDGGHHFVITFAGKIDTFTGLDESGNARAYPGRPFQVYNG